MKKNMKLYKPFMNRKLLLSSSSSTTPLLVPPPSTRGTTTVTEEEEETTTTITRQDKQATSLTALSSSLSSSSLSSTDTTCISSSTTTTGSSSDPTRSSSNREVLLTTSTTTMSSAATTTTVTSTVTTGETREDDDDVEEEGEVAPAEEQVQEPRFDPSILIRKDDPRYIPNKDYNFTAVQIEHAEDLLEAVGCDDCKKVQLLLEQYPDIINYQNMFGWSALHIATKRLNIDLIELLLIKYKARHDLYTANGEKQPFHVLCDYDDYYTRNYRYYKLQSENYDLQLMKRKQIITLYSTAGVDVNAQGIYGYTPLYFLCLNDEYELTHFLLSQPPNATHSNMVDVHAVDKKCGANLPEFIAERFYHRKIVKLLQQVRKQQQRYSYLKNVWSAERPIYKKNKRIQI